uniref:Prominin 1a n=1 Tax=Mastacembelus armatus TaxID=205130 RepID=A0A7N8XB05_9TELE
VKNKRFLFPNLLPPLPGRRSASPYGYDGSPRRLPPPGKLEFGYVPAGVYETLAHYEPGPIGILFHMLHTFLYAVQPNAFPQDLIVKLAKDKFGAIQTEYQKAIYYEIGFLVCAAVGLLFMVLMPVVGLFFCMCRCCDNCGGEMHQRQRKNADCRRGLLGTLLFSTSLAITIGVLCAYAANQNLSSQVKNIRRLVNTNMRDLHTFANDTPMQIDYLISQYATVKKKVIYNLNNIGPLLGGRIHHQLDKEVHPALDRVLNMAGAMRETKEALENVSVSLEVLQEGTGKLNFNLSLIRTNINQTLNDPGCHDEASDATTVQLCRNIRQSLSQLQISANFTRVQNLITKLRFLPQGYASLNNTPNMVFEQTGGVVESIKNLMDGIGNNISRFSKKFPVQRCLSDFTIFINHAHAKIEDYYPEIDKMDFYRWIGCIALCCMVVLVLAFNYLGLLCGTLGYDKHASPTTRGCISNTGGTMLMAGVGFSFIFSWVLMGVVTIIFLAGGNMEKLVCEPFHTKELFKVVDTPHLVNPEWKNFIPGYMYNDSDLELTTESLYRQVRLSLFMYFGDSVVSATFQRQCCGDDYSSHHLLHTCFLMLYLHASFMFTFGYKPRGPLQSALKGYAGTLRQIHSQQIIPMEQATVMPPCVISVYRPDFHCSGWLLRCFTVCNPQSVVCSCLLFTSPFSNILDTAEIITCSFLVDSMNTFWMGLGCSTLFLLPSIILAVKLAKYYRRMDTEDVYDE